MTRNPLTRFLLVLILVSAASFTSFGLEKPERAYAQALDVTSLADDGIGSLRWAIEQAQLAPDPATITFSVSGTIFLDPPASTPGLDTNRYFVNTPITIIGNNQITIDGGGATQIFFVDIGGALVLNGVNMVNGYADYGETWAGGCVHLDGGSLVMNNSTMNNCEASSESGALYIANIATVEINNSTISNSVAQGDATIFPPGGSPGGANGGGILNFGTLSINNSTISGNSAPNGDGGGIFNTGVLNLMHTTIANNQSTSTGGIFNSGSGNVTLAGTLISNNGVIRNCLPQVGWVDAGYNLSTDGFCALLTGNNAAIDLGPLANNGGPTQTHAPGSGSPALNLIPNGTLVGPYTCNQTGEPLDTDQRGLPRPLSAGGDCDSGSIETIDDVNIIVNPATVTTNENGTVGTFTISLGTQPSVVGASVFVPLTNTDATEGTVPALVEIPYASWATGVEVTVTPVNDPFADGDIAYTIITEDPYSAAPEYDAFTAEFVDDVVVTNVDDDGAGVLVSAISGDTTEDGDTATFNVALTAQPTNGADVTIALSSNDETEGTVPATVVIPNADWQIGVDVTVTGQDDDIIDGDILYTIITGDVTSAAPEYEALGGADVGNVDVTNIDNDAAGVVITPVDVETSEDGDTATFNVSLASQPQPVDVAEVTVELTSSDLTEGTVSAFVTIPAADWDVGVDVTVTGQDDDIIDGDILYTITTGEVTSAQDADYDALVGADVDDIDLTNLDNDAAGVIITPVDVETSEDGDTATFNVSLASQPQPVGVAEVTVELISSDPGEGIAPASVTIPAADWAVGVDVTVTGQDDDFADGDILYTIITNEVTSAQDADYDALTGADVDDVVLTNLDNDAAGVIITPIDSITDEDGGQATFNVSLTSEPTAGADVNVALTSSDLTEGIVLTPVTIPNGQWAAGVDVIVTGADDDIIDGDVLYTIVTGDVTSAAPEYDAITGDLIDDVDLTNQDNDVAGVVITPVDVESGEDGDTATFTVALTSQPQPVGVAEVTVELSSSDETEGTVPASVTIPNALWQTGVTVIVTGQDDVVIDGDIAYTIITGDVISADPDYDVLVGGDVDDVSVTNLDNDAAGVVITPLDVESGEDGDTATFNVALASQPQPAGVADVTVELSSTDETEGTVPAFVTIPNGQWQTGLNVTITGVDDDVVDGDISYTIITGEVTSADPNYDALIGGDVDDVAVTNLDNDVAGVNVSVISNATGEDGTTATFTVTLSSQPTGGADVTVALSSSDVTEGTVPASVLILNGQWQTGVTVTVTGVDDAEADGPQIYTIITGDVTSAAPEYAAITGDLIADVSVTNADNDAASIVVSPVSGLSTGEDGTNATFTVSLTSQPTGGADVTIPLTSTDVTEGTVPASVTIPNAQWQAGVTVTVTGVDDTEDDGDIAYTITTGDAASAAPEYAAFTGDLIADVSVTNIDNDTAGINVSAISNNTGEDGTNATFAVTLTSQPAGGADVTIPLTSTDVTEGTVPASVTIPNAQWQTGVTVTVTGVDDTEDDGDIAYTIITGDPASADPLYDNFADVDVADVPVTNIDNDTAGINVSAISNNTGEDGTNATFTVTLTSQPTGGADVTIPLTSTDVTEGTVPASVTIPNAQWQAGVTVTVTGVDDTEDDGDIAYTITTGDATSAAPEYAAFTGDLIADVPVTNIDNDTAGINVSAISNNTGEDGTNATFTVSLTSQPTGGADVTIPLTSTDVTEGTVPASVTIPNAQWQTGVTVTVTGVDDTEDDGDIAYTITTGDATSAAPEYAAFTGDLIADVSVTNIDNDTAGINVSAISNNTGEDGTNATFAVTLTSQPAGGADVTIPLTSTDVTEGTVPASVTIPNAQWQTGVTVTVTGVDDTEDDGDIAYTIITGDPASADPLYDNFADVDVADVSVTNVDNDDTGIVVSAISGDTSEDGTTATFTIRLSSQPTGGADVTIPLTSDNPAEGTVPASVTIPNAQWQAGVTVTVTGVDDLVVDGNIAYTIITGDPTSADPLYDNLGAADVADVAVVNLDNDAAIVANPDFYDTKEDKKLTVDALTGVLSTDTGGNGNPLRAVLETGPSFGTLAYFNDDGSFEYVPNSGFYGTDTFTYYATDETNVSASAIVTINVALVNNDALANDDFGDGPSNTAITIDVLANDQDPDGDTLSIVEVTQPSNGQAVISNGKLQYTSAPGFTGTVTMSYTVTDGLGQFDSATVTINIWLPVPLCSDFDGSTNEIIRADVPSGTITDGSVFCRVMVESGTFVQPSSEIGQMDVLNRGVIQAVDVFALYHNGSPTALFNYPVTTCLQGSGAFLYLDATVYPRSVTELPVFERSGYTCANIPNAGTVVLVSGSASVTTDAPAQPAATGPSVPLANCMVTTRNILNLRATPSTTGSVIRLVPYDVTLSALERSGPWFYVDYLGERGWVSASYVTPDGACGQ